MQQNTKTNILSTAFISLFLSIISLSINAKNIERVVFITLDGVRWQEVHQNKQYLNKLWSNHLNTMYLYVNNESEEVKIATIPTSLPSYHTMASGVFTPCSTNECGYMKHDTVFENVKSKLNLPKEQVAVFAAWKPIKYAAEHKLGNITIDVADNLPGQRSDKDTFKAGFNYFKQYKPKLLWISLDEADANGHGNNWEGYLEAIKQYDNLIDNFINYLKTNNLYETTAIIITTDHGRGDGDNWHSHGPHIPESLSSWVISSNKALIPVQIDIENGKMIYSTLSIRPTIEKLLIYN